LDWSEAESPAGAGLLGLYRQLTAFRRGHPELAAGSVGGAHVTLDDGGWLSWELAGLRVVANFAAAECTVEVSGGSVLLATEHGTAVAGTALTLPGYGVAVLG
ncbi:MAG: DUF3459 domain-containing protein, partial [Actinomycetales bacterium]